MSNVYDFFPQADEAFEADELFTEADEADEADEAARRPRRRFRAPIRTPQRGGAVAPRPAAGFATRAELMATANRLDAKIGQVSTGIKALDGRVRTLDTDQGKLRTALTAETKKRETLTGQVNNLQQMSMILPLLTTQKTVTLSAAVDAIPAQSKVMIDSGDTFSRMLPMLLFSGMGSGGGQSGSSGGMMGDNNNMMMLALIMSMK